MATDDKCFACARALRKDKPAHVVRTLDGQTAHVGPDCFNKIMRAGAAGYQPPLGGPRLYTREATK